MTKAIMFQGAGSNVGKSLLVAGCARALRRRGYSVAPFKPQNMSNNAAVTVDGGEIGRAQALQARAAGLLPTVDMNPVLLKPESDTGAQVIVHGKRLTTLKARDYGKMKAQLLPAVMDSFHRLRREHDIILIEGAGSPAEINLREGDIANMGFAEAANIPVILAGDIDRGGVIAQLVGTHAVLDQHDRSRIKAFLINKFRGDPTLFARGAQEIETRTGWENLGTLPWFPDAWKLPAEDVMDISSKPGGEFKIVVPRLTRIANFDDLDPLVNEPNVTVEIVDPGHPLPADADLVLIPGSKSTMRDLDDFRTQGWDIDLHAHIRRGGYVLGICGGYQMLGREIIDDQGVEGVKGRVDGLGHLNISTALTPTKTLALTRAVHVDSGHGVDGYEIHIGKTTGPDCDRGWLQIDDRLEGAVSTNGRVMGCYLHGLFASDGFRKAFLEKIGAKTQNSNFEETIEHTLDSLAAHVEAHLNVDQILEIATPL